MKRRYSRGTSAYEKVMAQLRPEPCRYPLLSDCLVFTGSRIAKGYGHTWDPDAKIMKYTHRVVMEHHHGPSDLWVCHACDNPPCCNIEHLRYCSRTEDAIDMVVRGGGKNQHGTYLTPEQVLAIRIDKRLLREIAADYDISTTTVSDIRNRKRWKHL